MIHRAPPKTPIPTEKTCPRLCRKANRLASTSSYNSVVLPFFRRFSICWIGKEITGYQTLHFGSLVPFGWKWSIRTDVLKNRCWTRGVLLSWWILWATSGAIDEEKLQIESFVGRFDTCCAFNLAQRPTVLVVLLSIQRLGRTVQQFLID